MIQIKKKQELPYSEEIRELGRSYKCLPKFQIRLLLEFCEYDLANTEKILKLITDYKKPDLVIKELVDKPELAEEIVGKYIEEYKLKFGEDKKEEGNEIVGKKEEEQIKVEPFFEKLSPDLIFEIVLFLNPLQLFQFIQLKEEYMVLYKQMKVPVQNYFKKICKHLFLAEPKLPEVSVFQPIREYITARPIEFTPNMRNMVNTDLRYFIWQSRLSDFRVSREYYESFGNFEDIFVKAPRIHFNGYYFIREKYTHRCEPTFEKPLGGYQVVQYYRYVRFFPDGSLLYQVSNKKLKPDQLVTLLSIYNFQEGNGENDTMKGQYIQFKNKLHFKFFRSAVIFNFETNLESSESVFDVMRVMRFWMEIVDSRFIVQEEYSYKKFDEKFFNYVRFEPFAEELPLNIQRCSL